MFIVNNLFLHFFHKIDLFKNFKKILEIDTIKHSSLSIIQDF